MSIKYVSPLRSEGSLLKQAVLLALARNWNINTMEDIPSYTYLDNYILRDRKSDKSLIGIVLKFNDIEFTEYTNKTQYNPYYKFQTFKCKQYPIDSTEDKQQIEHLANLILKFCIERMNDHQLDNHQSSPKRFRDEIHQYNFDDYSRMKMGRFRIS
jgi:hypothetical protein